MATINRDIFREFTKEGFFDEPRHIDKVVNKLDTRGFAIKQDKRGLVAQLLTKLCQEGLLERKKDSEQGYTYKKRAI